MKGSFHARFLGDAGGLTARAYPVNDKMKGLRKIFVYCFVGVFATIGFITVVKEIRHPRPWWVARWPAIADSKALLDDCSRLLDQNATNYYARVNGGASLVVDRPPAIRALNPSSVDVILGQGQGVIIRLHPGKGPTSGYIVVPSLKDAADLTLPSNLRGNGRYYLQTEHHGIYTFEDAWGRN